MKKKSWRFERVRVLRLNGWAKAVIVSETSGRCHVAMTESFASSKLTAARHDLMEHFKIQEQPK